MTITLTGTDYNAPAERDANGHPHWPTVTVEARFTRREHGGWQVVRADNGRILGWLVKTSDGKWWEARVFSSAFRGDDVNDLGNVLDEVPGHLTRELSTEPGRHAEIGGGRTREEAAHDIVQWLTRHHAPAVGFGRKPGVVRYADKHPRRYALLRENAS